MKKIIVFPVLVFGIYYCNAQQKPKHEDTEFYTPVPKVVSPGKENADPPSDAIILFDGKNIDQWVSADDTTKPANWIVNKKMPASRQQWFVSCIYWQRRCRL
jgi:hypothetical protein